MSKWSVAKEIVESVSELAAENAADEVGMLEALISTALVSLNASRLRSASHCPAGGLKDTALCFDISFRMNRILIW